jgi:hypothetical protein
MKKDITAQEKAELMAKLKDIESQLNGEKEEQPITDEVEEFSLAGAAILIHNKTANSLKVKVSDTYLSFITKDFEKIASINTEGRSVSDMEDYRIDKHSNNADDFEFFFIEAGFGSKDKGQLQIKRNGSIYGSYKASYDEYYNLTKKLIFCNMDSFGWQQDRITGEWVKMSYKNKKKAGTVVQNLFFDTNEEMQEYMKQQKGKENSTQDNGGEIPETIDDALPEEGGTGDGMPMSDINPSDDNTTPASTEDGGDKSLPEQREEQAKASAKGGEEVEKKADEDTDDKQLSMGIAVEKEHAKTISWIKEYYNKNRKFPPEEEVFKSIAKDHLSEFKDYYTKLKTMESSKQPLKETANKKMADIHEYIPPEYIEIREHANNQGVISESAYDKRTGEWLTNISNAQHKKELMEEGIGLAYKEAHKKIATSIQTGDASVKRFVDQEDYEYDGEFQKILSSNISDDEKFVRLVDKVKDIVQNMGDEKGTKINSVNWEDIEVDEQDIQRLIDSYNEGKELGKASDKKFEHQNDFDGKSDFYYDGKMQAGKKVAESNKCPYCNKGKMEDAKTTAPTVRKWKRCSNCGYTIQTDELNKIKEEKGVMHEQTEANPKIKFIAEKKIAESKIKKEYINKETFSEEWISFLTENYEKLDKKKVLIQKQNKGNPTIIDTSDANTNSEARKEFREKLGQEFSSSDGYEIIDNPLFGDWLNDAAINASKKKVQIEVSQKDGSTQKVSHKKKADEPLKVGDTLTYNDSGKEVQITTIARSDDKKVVLYLLSDNTCTSDSEIGEGKKFGRGITKKEWIPWSEIVDNDKKKW